MNIFLQNFKKICIKYRYIIIFFVVIYICIFCMNHFNLKAPDEYNYSNIAWTSHRIESFQDILTSQLKIYQNWSGRIPVTALIQVFLYVGTIIFDLLNPILFIILICMVCKLAKEQFSLFNIGLIMLSALVLTRSFWEKYIWLSGSLNYLWPVTLMLVVMYLFYEIIVHHRKLNLVQSILFIIMSFFAGWSQENVAFVLGTYIIILCFINRKEILKDKKNIQILLPAIILFGIGAILLLFSPGNFARMGTSDSKFGISGIIHNVIGISPLIVLYMITGISLMLHKNKVVRNESIKILKHYFGYFMMPIIIGILPMFIISEFPARSMLPYEICLLICTVSNIGRLYQIYKKEGIKFCCTVLIVTFVSLLLIDKAVYVTRYYLPYQKKIQSQIQYAKENNISDVAVDAFSDVAGASRRRIALDGIPRVTGQSIINAYMSLYYHINSLVAIREGYCLVEIDLEEETIQPYTIISKETNQIISNRIMNIEVPMPETSLKNRAIFEIPLDELDHISLVAPENIKINNVYITSSGGKKLVDKAIIGL